jgi:hypothetical protein
MSRTGRARASCFAALLVAGLAAACAPTSNLPQISKEAAEAEAEKQRQLVLDDYTKEAARLGNVSYRLFTANADLCKDRTRPATGLLLVDKDILGDDFRKTVSERFALADGVAVLAAAGGSPAEKAGLTVGDRLVRLGDWAVPAKGASAKEVGRKIQELAKDGKAVSVTVRHADEGGGESERTVTLAPTTACAFDVGLVFADDVNALADGTRVLLFTGMLRFADTDEELATVVGHEMAHNLMDHVSKQEGNALLGTILDLLVAGVGVNTQGMFTKMAMLAYGKEFEAEADYVGLYLMARAGYKIHDTPNFWRRMAIAHPGSVKGGFFATHPATPERFLALEKTVAEIEGKERSNQALLPESEIPEKTPATAPQAHAPWQ